MKLRRHCLFASVLLLLSTQASAVSSIALPAWICSKPDAIFINGLETANAIPHDASLGSGGAIRAMWHATSPLLDMPRNFITCIFLPTIIPPAQRHCWWCCTALLAVTPMRSLMLTAGSMAAPCSTPNSITATLTPTSLSGRGTLYVNLHYHPEPRPLDALHGPLSNPS